MSETVLIRRYIILLSGIPGLFAEGGRIEYKDGPKDPKRRTFMKAAAGTCVTNSWTRHDW